MSHRVATRTLTGRASLMLIAGLALVVPVLPAKANPPGGVDYYSQLSCAQLWYERNAILARHGYCFRTQRALATFGNTCRPPYGKLPSNLARVVDQIRGWERRRSCG